MQSFSWFLVVLAPLCLTGGPFLLCEASSRVVNEVGMLPVRVFLPAWGNASQAHSLCELNSTYTEEFIPIQASTTALVMVDVWDDSSDPVLAENEAHRLLPLLSLARAAGLLIIHAPSEGPLWKNITVQPGESLWYMRCLVDVCGTEERLQ